MSEGTTTEREAERAENTITKQESKERERHSETKRQYEMQIRTQTTQKLTYVDHEQNRASAGLKETRR